MGHRCAFCRVHPPDPPADLRPHNVHERLPQFGPHRCSGLRRLHLRGSGRSPCWSPHRVLISISVWCSSSPHRSPCSGCPGRRLGDCVSVRVIFSTAVQRPAWPVSLPHQATRLAGSQSTSLADWEGRGKETVSRTPHSGCDREVLTILARRADLGAPGRQRHTCYQQLAVKGSRAASPPRAEGSG